MVLASGSWPKTGTWILTKDQRPKFRHQCKHATAEDTCLLTVVALGYPSNSLHMLFDNTSSLFNSILMLLLYLTRHAPLCLLMQEASRYLPHHEHNASRAGIPLGKGLWGWFMHCKLGAFYLFFPLGIELVWCGSDSHLLGSYCFH